MTHAEHLSETDAKDITAAVRDMLEEESITIIQLDGFRADERPPKGLARSLKSLHRLVEGYGKQLIITPI